MLPLISVLLSKIGNKHKKILLNHHLFGRELFIRFTARIFVNVYHCVRASFPFGFEGGMWDLFFLLAFSHEISWMRSGI